ncbi:unnamed protein product [Camellia sinensis]
MFSPERKIASMESDSSTLSQITNYVMSIVNKKNKNASLKAHAVKNHLWVFVNALIGNPAFDSQTKGTLTIRTTHRNGKVLAFYSMSEYESWKESWEAMPAVGPLSTIRFVIIVVICNAAAMEALPIFLYSLITAWGAILILVTLILLFGEIIPQSVCSRYGLAIGAVVAPFVCILVWICFPVAYPISKLGHVHVALFRRAELKTLVDLHGNELCEGNIGTLEEWTMEMIKLHQAKLLFKLNRPFEVASRGYSFIIGFSKALALHESMLPFCMREVWVIIACLALINTIASHYSDGQVAPDIETEFYHLQDASLSMLPWPKPAVWPLVPPDAPSEVFEKEKYSGAEGDDDDAEADDDETDKDADITEESAHDEL